MFCLGKEPSKFKVTQKPQTFITRNRCKCKVCGKVLESRFTHEWVKCDCKENFIYTDGGLDYFHRGGRLENLISLDEFGNVDEFGNITRHINRENTKFIINLNVGY
jgi:hypothetical protein